MSCANGSKQRKKLHPNRVQQSFINEQSLRCYADKSYPDEDMRIFAPSPLSDWLDLALLNPDWPARPLSNSGWLPPALPASDWLEPILAASGWLVDPAGVASVSPERRLSSEIFTKCTVDAFNSKIKGKDNGPKIVNCL